MTQESHAPDLVVARVVSVEDHPGARAPSYKLTLDLGGRGRREATLPAGQYEGDELLGRQVVCHVQEEVVAVMGAHSHSRGLVLVGPQSEVEDGSAVA